MHILVVEVELHLFCYFICATESKESFLDNAQGNLSPIELLCLEWVCPTFLFPIFYYILHIFILKTVIFLYLQGVNNTPISGIAP